MTERTAQYIQLRNQNLTYAQIGKMFGVSRQAVNYAVNTAQRRASCASGDLATLERQRRSNSIARIRYPAIRKWATANNLSIRGMELATGANLRYGLTGGNLTKRAIDSLCTLTGLSYEEAFKEEDA